MKRLLLDVDGVITDFIQCYLDCLHEATGIRKGREEVTQWDVGDALGLDRTQRAAVHSCMVLPGRAFSMKPYPSSVECVKWLSTLADVYFVTAPFPSPTWTYDREQWLKQHFGQELGKKVTHTADKHICSGDVFVDDKPKNVEMWADSNPQGTAVLWAQRYNEGSDWRLRVSSWREVADLLVSWR